MDTTRRRHNTAKISVQNALYSPAHSRVFIVPPLACSANAILPEVDLNGKSSSEIPRSTNHRSLGEVSSIWNGFRNTESAEHSTRNEDAIRDDTYP